MKILAMSELTLFILLTVGFIGLFVVFMVYGLKFKMGVMRKLNAPYRKTVVRDKPLKETIGKLIRKVKDDNSDSQSIVKMENYRHLNMKDNPNLIRYYLTFETKKGLRSFTVTETDYKKYKINKFGIIKHHRSKFHSFSYRSKESLGL